MSESIPVIAPVGSWQRVELKSGALLQPLGGAISWTATDPDSGKTFASHVHAESIHATSDHTIWVRAVGNTPIRMVLTQ